MHAKYGSLQIANCKLQIVNCRLPDLHFSICILHFAIACRVRRSALPSTAIADEAISPTGEVICLFDGKTLGDCYMWLKDPKREDLRKCSPSPME